MNLNDIDVSRWPHWRSDDGNVLLVNGDCLEVLPVLPKVDAVVTDPPYGVNLGSTSGTGGSRGMRFDGYASYVDSYENFVEIISVRLQAYINNSTRAIVWTGPHIHEQAKPTCIGGVYCPAGAGRTPWGFKTFLPVLLYGQAPDIHLGAPFPTTIQSSEKSIKNGHPCPKPLGWIEWNVNLASRCNQTIADPFMGSGTTGVACVRLGRQFIGIELEPKYYEIAIKRIRAEQERFPLFEKQTKKEPQQLPGFDQ
jgi:DNA modification methylase